MSGKKGIKRKRRRKYKKSVNKKDSKVWGNLALLGAIVCVVVSFFLSILY